MVSLAALLPATALTRYDDEGNPQLTAGERVLMVLRRTGWVTRSEINEALALDDDTEGTSSRAERELVSAALAWQVKSGRVQTRVWVGSRQYRLVASAFGVAKEVR